MFSLIRALLVIGLCLVGIGLYRGWFSFTTPHRDAQSNNVNISVSVNATKLEADVAKVEEKIAEEIASHTNQPDDQAAK
jgi:hypothetical protein